MNRSGFALRVFQLFLLCEYRRGATSVYISFNFMDWIGFNFRKHSILCFLWQTVLHFLKSQVATIFSLRLLKFLLLLNLHYFIYDILIIVCLSLSRFSWTLLIFALIKTNEHTIAIFQKTWFDLFLYLVDKEA